jgi:DNA-binding transcriptional LysR family regulator
MMQAEIVLADEIHRGHLVPILQNFIPEPKPMHLIYPRDRQPTPKLSTFIEFIVEQFGLPAKHSS